LSWLSSEQLARTVPQVRPELALQLQVPLPQVRQLALQQVLGLPQQQVLPLAQSSLVQPSQH
jgi:hypothetical protein